MELSVHIKSNYAIKVICILFIQIFSRIYIIKFVRDSERNFSSPCPRNSLGIAFRLAGNSCAQERSRLNLNGSRQLSKSATELRDSEIANSSPSRRGDGSGESGIVHHHRHHRHLGTVSVAQRTHTFFATLKSRWTRSRSKERKKSKDGSGVLSQDASQLKNPGAESDYAADYSSEHSRSSSATQSPARHCLNRPGERYSSNRYSADLLQICQI